MVEPLRKRTLTGERYTRTAAVETLLVELAALSHDDLVARCAVGRNDEPRYVPSECLLYFVRDYRGREVDAHYERLYKLLAARVARRLPKPEDANGKTVSLTRATIHEAAFDRFVELLAADRTSYCEKLDYYEVRFDGAVASLRKDAQDRVWRNEQRSVGIDSDGTGEPTAEVEEAALEHASGSFDPFDAVTLDAEVFRSRFDTAIDALHPDHRTVVLMIRQGIPIDSQDSTVPTIAKALGRSEKTVRTYRDKAYAALRAALATDTP